VKIFTKKNFYRCGEIYVSLQNIFSLLTDNHISKCVKRILVGKRMIDRDCIRNNLQNRLSRQQ